MLQCPSRCRRVDAGFPRQLACDPSHHRACERCHMAQRHQPGEPRRLLLHARHARGVREPRVPPHKVFVCSLFSLTLSAISLLSEHQTNGSKPTGWFFISSSSASSSHMACLHNLPACSPNLTSSCKPRPSGPSYNPPSFCLLCWGPGGSSRFPDRWATCLGGYSASSLASTSA